MAALNRPFFFRTLRHDDGVYMHVDDLMLVLVASGHALREAGLLEAAGYFDALVADVDDVVASAVANMDARAGR
jgi:hypothetical protein